VGEDLAAEAEPEDRLAGLDGLPQQGGLALDLRATWSQ
jgi:hypothetical protein